MAVNDDLDERLSDRKRRLGRPVRFDRAAALEAAMQSFWRHGYEGTSMAMLTAAMECSAPSLYAAFGSKVALYREALSHYLAQHGPALASASGPESAFDFVERYLRRAADWLPKEGKPRGCMVSTGALQAGPELVAAAAFTADLRAIMLNAFATELQARLAREGLPAAIDAPALARFYAAVMQGMSVQAIDGADSSALHAVVDFGLAAWPRSD